MRVLNSALDAQLNIAAPTCALFFHVGPNFSGHVLLEKGVAIGFKLGVSDDWDALGHGTSDTNSMLVKLLLRHQVRKVFYLQLISIT